jgi:hypothetical protein
MGPVARREWRLLHRGHSCDGPNASPFLINANDEMARGDVIACDAHDFLWIKLTQHERVILPANELLDKKGRTVLGDDDIAAADWWLKRVNMEQPSWLIAWREPLTRHIDRIGIAYAREVRRARRVADRLIAG